MCILGNALDVDAGHTDTVPGATGVLYSPPATVMVWPVTQLPASLAR